MSIPLRPSLRVVCAVAALTSLLSCNNLAGTTDPTRTSFLPFRISVQDLTTEPSPVHAGQTTKICFRLTSNGSDAPIYWSSHFQETPSRGGRLTATSGGPLKSGSVVEIAYETKGETVALITLYPGSTPDAPTGDGSGDWHSFAVEVLGN